MGVVIPEDQLKEMHEMVKENNRMLKDMRRSAFIGGILHVAWLIIAFVVLPYFAWLFIQPYLEGALSAYQSAQGKTAAVSADLQKIKDIGSGFDLNGILDQVKQLTGK
jgi:hypothetical protein